MKKIEQIKRVLAQHKLELKDSFKVKEIGIFGSYVKNEQKEDSDLDILVEFEDSISLLKFVKLENYLSKLLNIKVDLVMKDVLKPRIGKHILEELAII